MTELQESKLSLDSIFLHVIINNRTFNEVREKALEVLIKNFNQRDILIRELSKTDIVVNETEYEIHLRTLRHMRNLRVNLTILMRDERYKSMIGSDGKTQENKEKIISILNMLKGDLKSLDPLSKRRLQNLLKNANIIDELLENTLQKMAGKEMLHRDIFQATIDFFLELCHNNPNCQNLLLPHLNYFLDLMNHRIVTDTLITEIIKSNADEKQRKNFAEYLIDKIIE